MSRPARALWIEIFPSQMSQGETLSRPARALWIEIFLSNPLSAYPEVEAREGLVD